jgi:hypothetical protein
MKRAVSGQKNRIEKTVHETFAVRKALTEAGKASLGTLVSQVPNLSRCRIYHVSIDMPMSSDSPTSLKF